MGHYLKLWADRYKVTGEVKGATINLNHRYLYVTSNWSITEMFTEKKPKMV